MENKTLLQQLTDLFKETGKAHHQAYIEMDGFDLEWPIWYAEYMHDRLSEALNAKVTKSELVYFLILFEDEQSLRDPEAFWPEFYAKSILERLTEEEGLKRLRHRIP